MSSDPALTHFVHSLPKTETHLHFEGALPFELLQRVRPEFRAPPASWSADFKYPDFATFDRALIDWAFSWFTTPERYHEAGKLIFARHLAQNVRYVETSFASGIIEFGGLDGSEVLSAIRASVPAGLEVRIFLGIHHNGAGPTMRPHLEKALGWSGLAGIDLHGPEDLPLEPWTKDYWAAARRAGKCTKAHAGEFLGPAFIRRVLDELQPHRIEHGVRAVEDPSLLRELVRRGIALDVCPISNQRLMPGVTLARHPIRELLDAGVTVTVSTDDPLMLGNSLTDEYVALAEQRECSRAELARVARHGFEVALVDEPTRRRWLEELAIASRAVG